MPTTWSFGFYGGNPRQEGPGQHQDGTTAGTPFETVDPAHINNLEYAVWQVASGVTALETAVNSMISTLRAHYLAPSGNIPAANWPSLL
jgi:hypothetical protein